MDALITGSIVCGLLGIAWYGLFVVDEELARGFRLWRSRLRVLPRRRARRFIRRRDGTIVVIRVV